MALFNIGGLVLRTFKPVLVNPCFVIESTSSLQVRHAKRKGYRERARILKLKEKKAAVKPVETKKNTFWQKVSKITKTEDRDHLLEVPDDDVFIEADFKYKKYSIAEAAKFHQEYHHPTVFNNPDAPITVRIEFNMGGGKKKGLHIITGAVGVPHPFTQKTRKDILVLCDESLVSDAFEAGATVAGGVKIVEKIKEGAIQPSVFDHILCDLNFSPQIASIRGLMKERAPKMKDGSLSGDIISTIKKFRHGIVYHCKLMQSPPDFGMMECQIGAANQDPVHIEENFKALIDELAKVKPLKGKSLIHWIWCLSPPSKERFAIDIWRYMKKPDTEQDDDDDDDDEEVTKKSKKPQKAMAKKPELEEKEEVEEEEEEEKSKESEKSGS